MNSQKHPRITMKAFFALAILTSSVLGAPSCSRKLAQSGISSAVPSATATAQTKKLATGWYGGWYGERETGKFTASQIPWDKYSYVTYGFACVYWSCW